MIVTTAAQRISYEKLIDVFTTAGWRFEGESRSGSRAQTAFWKRVRVDANVGPLCLSNDHLTIHATIDTIPLGDGGRGPVHSEGVYRTVMFEIVGEYRPNMWTKLQVYSVGWDDAVEQMGEIEQELLVAWDSLCNSARRVSSRGERR